MWEKMRNIEGNGRKLWGLLGCEKEKKKFNV